jgi:hypothetical protein
LFGSGFAGLGVFFAKQSIYRHLNQCFPDTAAGRRMSGFTALTLVQLA